MVDWTASMQQSFEYYIVNPNTWKNDRKLNTVKSSSIVRDKDVETLGSASIDLSEAIGECYVRIYLVIIQNGVTYRVPLATVLTQTLPTSFDGKVNTISADAYTPLIELKENPPPIGYSVLEGENILDRAYEIVREYTRAPIVKTESSDKLEKDFVSNTDDTWMSFTADLIGCAKHQFDIDPDGQIMFAPVQDIKTLQPVWTYNDSNTHSILYPEITTEYDLYKIPNVVEVIYSSGKRNYTGIAINDNPNSPVSTVTRGRIIKHRVINPTDLGVPSQSMIQKYAEDLLRAMSAVEYTIQYTHGYCPVRLGDCVRINYERAGIFDVKAKVIYQSIKCEPGCPVTEKAVYTSNLWKE